MPGSDDDLFDLDRDGEVDRLEHVLGVSEILGEREPEGADAEKRKLTPVEWMICIAIAIWILAKAGVLS